MRQVGDRLIPVGVTSGRVHALSPEEAVAAAAAAANADASGSRRSRRRQQPQNGSFEQFIGMGGQDLEEVKVNFLGPNKSLALTQISLCTANAHGSDEIIIIGPRRASTKGS